MTQAQKIIKNKVGLLNLAQTLGKRLGSLQDLWLFPRQFLSLQRALRHRW